MYHFDIVPISLKKKNLISRIAKIMFIVNNQIYSVYYEEKSIIILPGADHFSNRL